MVNIADGTVVIDTLVDTKGFSKGVTNMQSQFSRLGSTIKRIGATIGLAFSVGAIISFAKEAVNLGSDLQEVQNVVNVTFGGMSSQIDEFAQNAITQFGLSELSAKQYASTLGAIFKSTGFDIASAAEMSQTLTGLAGDIASFYNLSGDEAFAKLRAGITGETEPLKQLGINLSVANLEAYALSQGITKAYNAMSQQEQMMLRYNYILSVTADAQGDFARTSSGWANQTRILKEQFNSLKATIGQGLINALTPALQVINTVLAGLQKIANAFKQLTALLFGDAGGAGDVAESIATGYGVAADNANDLTQATKEAGKAAEKSLAPFDEIYTLDGGGSGSKESGNSGGGGMALPQFDTTVNGDVTDGISPKIQAIVDKITSLLQPLKEIDLTPAITAFNNLKKALEPITTALFSGLEWAWNNIFVPFAGWVIEDAIPAFLYALEGALNVVNAVLVAVQPLFEWLWTSFLQPIAEWTGGVIVDVLTAIGDGLTIVSDWITEHQALVEGIAIVVGAFAAAWVLVNGAITLWNAIGVIATGITTAFGAAVNFLTSPIGIVVVAIGALIAIVVLLAKNWDTIKAKTIEIWNKIKTFLINSWNSIKTKATAIWNSVKTFFSNAWNGIKNTAIKVWNAIKTFFVNLWNGIKRIATNVWNGIKSFFSNTWNGIKNTATKVWNSIKSFFTNTWNNIKTRATNTWNNVKTGFSNAWSNVKNKTSQVWGNIKTSLTNTWNSVKTRAANAWNNVKTGFSNAWSNVKNKTSSIWGGIKGTLSNTWGSIKSTASNAWNSVKNGAISAWNKLKTRTSDIWQNLISVIKKPINSIIGAINGMISGVVSGINAIIRALNRLSFTTPSWLPAPFGGKSFGFNISTLTAPQIPYLAQGAVIPPNAPFMAVLGDQKRGTNIEAPLATIEQAVRNVLTEGNIGVEVHNHIRYEGNLAQLARVLVPVIDTEIKRKGNSLAKITTF